VCEIWRHTKKWFQIKSVIYSEALISIEMAFLTLKTWRHMNK